MSDEHITGYDQDDEYFHQKDHDVLIRKRTQLDAQRAAFASMECPRCETTMTEVIVEHVKIDRCPDVVAFFSIRANWKS